MSNLKGLLGVRRMDRVPNARTRKLCWVAKGVYERIDENIPVGLEILKEWRMIGLVKGCM